MHVALFVHRAPPALGGAEAYAHRLAEFHRSHGDTVSVWTSTAVDLEAMWRPGYREADGPGRFRALHFPGRRYLLKALSLIPVSAWQALTLPCNPVCPRMWTESHRYSGPLDAVHAIAFPYTFPALCGLRLARRRGVPFLLTPFLHLGDPSDPRDRTRRQYTARPHRWLLQNADRVFVQTPSERDAVVNLGVSADRVVLQGLGVDPDECTGGDRNAARQRWGIGDEPAIGHLANNSEEKGTCDLLRAAAKLWAAGERFRVVLAGPEMPNFARFWHEFPEKDRVVRLGVLSDAEKRDFYAGIDAFALPSRSDSFGLVLLEAWANAKPVVAYRAGGPADLVRDRLDGRLAGCGRVEELAECLRDALAHPEYGDAGQKRIASEFVWSDKLARVRNSAIPQ